MSNKAPAKLRNRVTMWIWAIILVPLSGLAIAIFGGSVGVGAYILISGLQGDLSLPPVPSISPELRGIVLVAAIVLPLLAGWILVRYTWGPEFTDESVDSGMDTADDIEDRLGDD